VSYAIVITPDGKTVYVANFLSGTVTPITTATNIAGPAIPVGSDPRPSRSPHPAFTGGTADTRPSPNLRPYMRSHRFLAVLGMICPDVPQLGECRRLSGRGVTPSWTLTC
jgi:YVTN family beta-propeller protein